ncbi:intraflagellar transport protein 27 homolog isoform X1 [Salvelinus fontinalis]|uniref:Intraflagellar transport protein 27 homolog n=2 Tax=Salmoninae TaxID=504568 RepID=A0A8U0U0E4_SALNM|nr:intraflagellar transport protein 27 homolog [Salmo trutta]XP_038835098.1 intraflagellar transport protein 27 homolog [Salvelinus namaycush]XP_055768815.1 intraflagellar transport protein 27 homolog isoform X1 [Salvelinus fontinalis]XP_055768816.1 intraflagellar transport protein 27 homolog isoform X2 [Salvelinus fontinalis]XP_055771559.1 intraflagellar transport protein 27 homolog isoform X1 [Salvelinus fontinalis]
MVKLRARCLLVGDAAVGKSALSQMFRSDGAHFQKNYSMTAGVELVVKSVNIPETSDSVELYIFDSAGRETFVEACEKLWGQPSVLCLVFDVSSELSFSSCGRWLERVRAHCQGLHIPGVLVGNKSDLSSRREVETSVAQEWAQSQGLQYHETSAKEMENCEAPFLSLAQLFHALYQDRLQTIQNLA